MYKLLIPVLISRSSCTSSAC